MAKSFNDVPAPIQGAIMVAVAAAAAGLVFWYFVLPLNDHRVSLDKEVSKLKADNDRDVRAVFRLLRCLL